MRFLGLAVVTSAAILLGACNKDKAESMDKGDTASAMGAPAEVPAMDKGEMAAMAPVTGMMHEVKMIGDGTGYRFDPADITVKQGDGIKFIMVNGGPHNVAFDPATLSAAAKTQLAANMPEVSGELSGKLLVSADESYTISFAGVPAGTYDYYCTPHLALNMKGKITVQ